MSNITRKLIAVAALVPIAAGAWWATRLADGPPPPHALWRNGVIIHVRGCDDPYDEAALLTCAGLYCVKSVTEKLTNAQQARLSVTVHERDAGSGAIRIAGAIDQYLNARTLPTEFECNMRHYRRAEPALFIAGRR